MSAPAPATVTRAQPLIRMTNLFRAFNASAASGRLSGGNQTDNFGQSPLYAPSVFNFFPPDYKAPGTLAQSGLFSPEFLITTDSTAISSANKMRSAVYNQPSGTNPDSIVLDLSSLSALSSNPAALVDSLNYLLMAGRNVRRHPRYCDQTRLRKFRRQIRSKERKPPSILLVASPNFVF